MKIYQHRCEKYLSRIRAFNKRVETTLVLELPTIDYYILQHG
ncbi:hypothetical protein [Lactobacillus amylolyticus]|nr:hypothetical protein [Lactobacillus amylolyticus]